MASFQKTIRFLILFFITFISSTHAHTFQVGGKDGWTLHPSENYNSWSGRLRFLINDTLHFKYDGGTDSVLVVNKGDYDGCNANNPIKKMEGGDSMFMFDRSGPFYFITRNKSNCDQGQKMTVVVLALRSRSPPPSVATPPSSSTQPPSPAVSPVSPPSTSPVSPTSPAVSPVLPPSGSPEPSAFGAPIMTPPASSPSPGGGSADTPSGSPEPSASGAPIMTPPTSSPSPGGGSADSPGGGSADSPDGGSADSPGGGGGQSPGANSPSENGNTPSPPGRSGIAQPFSDSVITSLVMMMFALWGIN